MTLSNLTITIDSNIVEECIGIYEGAKDPFIAKQCRLESTDGSISKLSDVPLNKKYEDVNILLKANDGSIKELKPFLNTAMKINFLAFLEQGRKVKPFPIFNCYDYINLLYDKIEQPQTWDPERWSIQPFDAQNIPAGAAIMMFNGEIYRTGCKIIKIIHFAMHLGESFYISLIGSGYPLAVTTLEQLKDIYGEHFAVTMLP